MTENLSLEGMIEAGWSYRQMGDALGITRDAARSRARRVKEHTRVQTHSNTVTTDLQRLKTQRIDVDLRTRYTTALKHIEVLESEKDALLTIKNSPTEVIKIIASSNHEDDEESTAVIVASDWHVEENIKSSTVNHLNEFSLAIAEKRIHKFAENTVRLLKMFAKTTKLNKAILALLGDFISGYIHDELIENAELEPVAASIWVKDQLIAVIEHILEHTGVDLMIVCKCGNHSRTTQKTRFSTELGNSLEYFIYDSIHHHFLKNKRVQTVIENSYHTYVKVYDVMIRFHHGHALRYAGGVGGLYIPVHKAIDQWNKGIKADLDVFGHWHQLIASDRFIVNGSLIGHNSFAISIKAGYERPRQAFFLINSKYGKTINTAIFLED